MAETSQLYRARFELRPGSTAFLRLYALYVSATGHMPKWPIRFFAWAFCRVRLERA